METIHYKTGSKAARLGLYRAAPSNLKIITPAWYDWYHGYDDTTLQGDNPKLTPNFGLRRTSTRHIVQVL